MKKLAFLLLLITLPVAAQEVTLQKGVVVDGIKLGDSLNNSFAIYLPTYFEKNKQWPVLFIFDGKGRGRAAAQVLATAAEEQGYLIASSNNIDVEHSLEQNALTASRLMAGVSEMLPINLKQLAAIGSGVGARVATSLPLIFDNMLGAVAIGDQWINYEMLNRRDAFLFIGVVGDEQYSYRNMINSAMVLSEMGFETGVYIYEGSQDWPEASILSNAVGSLTLKAIRNNARPKNAVLVEQLYKDDLQLLDKLINKNNLLAANEVLNLMQTKYKGLINFSEVNAKQRELQKMPNFKLQQQQEDLIAEKEVRFSDDFFYFLNEDITQSNFENLGWWNYQKRQLDSLSANSQAQSKMALRLENFVSEYARLHLIELEKNRAPLESKLVANMILVIFDIENFDAYKQIIKLSTRDNDFQTAYFYLEEMLKHGYKDIEGLYNIEGTLGIKLTPEYNQIIQKYLGSSKFYDAQK